MTISCGFKKGITSYYADLALVRTGIISIEDFYSSWVSNSITQFEVARAGAS